MQIKMETFLSAGLLHLVICGVVSSSVCDLPMRTQEVLSTPPRSPFVSSILSAGRQSGLADFCGRGSKRCCRGRSSRQKVEFDMSQLYMQKLRYHMHTTGAAVLKKAHFALQDWQSSVFHAVIKSLAYPSVLGTHQHLIKRAAKHVCLLPFDAMPSCGNVRLYRRHIETYLSSLYVKTLVASNFSHVKELAQPAQECVIKNFAHTFLQSSIGKQLVNNLVCTTEALVCQPQVLIESISAAAELLTTVSRHEPTQSCLMGLARMWHCPYCSGHVHASTPPCNGLCLNVARGCLGDVNQLGDVFTPVILMIQNRLAWLNRTRHKLVSKAAAAITQFIAAVHQLTLSPAKPALLDQVQRTCGLFRYNSEGSRSSFELGCSPGSGSLSLSNLIKQAPSTLVNKFQYLDLFMAHDLCQFSSVNSHCHNGRTNSSYTRSVVSAELNARGLNPEVEVPREENRYYHEITAFRAAIAHSTSPSQHDNSNTAGASQMIIETSGWGDGFNVDDEDEERNTSPSGSGMNPNEETSWAICDHYVGRPSIFPQPTMTQTIVTDNDYQSVTEEIHSISTTSAGTSKLAQKVTTTAVGTSKLAQKVTTAAVPQRSLSLPKRTTSAHPQHTSTTLTSTLARTRSKPVPRQTKPVPTSAVVTQLADLQNVDLEKSSAFVPEVHLCMLLSALLACIMYHL